MDGYLRMVMEKLGCIVFNASQDEYHSKDIILENLIKIIKDYNSCVSQPINIRDFRKNKQ